MKNSTLGAIMQKTFAKSVTGCGIILDQDNDSWWDEISSIPPRLHQQRGKQPHRHS